MNQSQGYMATHDAAVTAAERVVRAQGAPLPFPVKISNQSFLLDYRDGAFQIDYFKNRIVKRFTYRMPETANTHIRNWFTAERLPSPNRCVFYQYSRPYNVKSACCVACRKRLEKITSDLMILMEYTERYKRYLYLMYFDLTDDVFFLVTQPISYNFDHAAHLVGDSLIITAPKAPNGDSIAAKKSVMMNGVDGTDTVYDVKKLYQGLADVP